ncbi:hypothetical protein D3C80_1517920 [compost metagenome]
MVSPFAAQQHPHPPLGEAADRLVVRRPGIAALAQALVADQRVHFVVAQHGDAIRRAGEPALRPGVLHFLGANGEGWIGDIQVRSGIERADGTGGHGDTFFLLVMGGSGRRR